MTTKRTKIFDGLFTSERVTFDLTQPMDEETFAELFALVSDASVVGRISRLEAYIKANSTPAPAVALRLEKMRSALAIAKRGGLRDVVFMAMECGPMSQVIFTTWGGGITVEINPNDPTLFKAGIVQIAVVLACDVGIVCPTTAFTKSTSIT
jgi:hypothetical protein